MRFRLRPARTDDIEALAVLWHDGWHDAHGAIVPAAWSRHRNGESFRQRTPGLIPMATVATEARHAEITARDLCGFHAIDGNFVTNLFVAASRRGEGAGTLLLRDAESQLAAAGHATGRLDCRHGNHRARQFYEQSGWSVVEDAVQHETVDGARLTLHAWIMEKQLAG